MVFQIVFQLPEAKSAALTNNKMEMKELGMFVHLKLPIKRPNEKKLPVSSAFKYIRISTLRSYFLEKIILYC